MKRNHVFNKKASVPFFLSSTVYIAHHAYVFRLQDTMTNTPQEFVPVSSMGAYMPISQLDSNDDIQYTTKSIWNNHPSAHTCTFFCLIYQLLLQVFCAPIPTTTTTTATTAECRPLAMMIWAWMGHTAIAVKQWHRCNTHMGHGTTATCGAPILCMHGEAATHWPCPLHVFFFFLLSFFFSCSVC